MRTYQGLTLSDQKVEIFAFDAYRDCLFIDCKVWGGPGSMWSIDDCTFIRCDIHGPLAQELIEQHKKDTL